MTFVHTSPSEGLIEGDGSFIVPKNQRNAKGVLAIPAVEITFFSKDKELSLRLKKELGFGQIYKKKGENCLALMVRNTEGLLVLVQMLNGQLRGPKIVKLHKLIDFLNIRYSQLNLVKLGLSESKIDSNSWLSILR